LASLALAQARKTEANSGRIWCHSEGIPNRLIVSKLGEIHKAKALGEIEFMAFLFSSLRVVCGLQYKLIVRVGKWPQSKRLQAPFFLDFRAIPIRSPAA
jgi:hypothetical protein